MAIKGGQKSARISLMALGAMLGTACALPASAQTAPQTAPQTGDAFMDTMGLTSQKAAATTHTDSAPVVSLRGDTTWLMSAFNATSENELSLFSSYDGKTFTSLASEAYRPDSGLLRDPSILRAKNGDYYVVYTTGWNGQSFGIAKSHDLRHWQHVTDVKLDLPGLTNTWAPEWFQDTDGSVSVVVSLSTGGTKGPFAAYVLKANADLSGFSAPVAMQGLGNNHIDTFPIKIGERYIVITKNETTKTLERAWATSLTGPWTIDRTGDWAGWGDWIEGPALVPIKSATGQDGWRIYFDDYRDKTYWYSDSFDGLDTWTKKQELGGVSGAVRHFTVIRQPTATVEAALKPANPPAVETWDKHSLMIDGKRVMIWSGEFQPFRLPSPSMWRDVLQKMKATGYNAVTLYIDWGYHTSEPGQYDFSGVRNVERAIQMAEDEGLYVIIRPGPYVNAELTMGGFPGWLVRQKAMARTDDPEYLKAVDEWQTQIDAIIARHQITTGGGRIIAYQIENELADTSPNRKLYMQHLADKVHADGITVPLFHNSASRLPNWTPPKSTAPWAVSGPTDLYAFDGYPGGGCNGTRDIGKPNTVPNWGMYGDTKPGKDGIVKAGALSSPNTPGFAAEIGGGWFDYWGSQGTYDCTSKRVGSAYVRTDFGSSLINGLTIHSVYMAYGGTSWGWLPASVVYSSYDYGAGIDEARNIRPKQLTFKQLGQFVEAATPLLTDLDKGPVLITDNPRVKLYHDIGANGEGDLIFAIHDPSNATTDDRFSFNLTTRDGTFPIQTQLKGQDGKLLLADYPLARQHLVYTTSDTQTFFAQGPRDIALLYGRAGEAGEMMLHYNKKPKLDILQGYIKSSYDTTSGNLKLDYVHQGLNIARIEMLGQPPLILLLADDATAQAFWRQDTPQGPVLERTVEKGSGALIREASLKGATLTLTGDTAEDTTLDIWAPAGVTAVTFNGQPVAASLHADGSLKTAAISGPAPVTLPDLMTSGWQRRMGSPEADPAFDDSAWRKTDASWSSATEATQPPAGQPVLDMSQYGFHHGDVWYRGHFTVSAKSTIDQANFFYGGGGAGMMQVWVDGRFIGQNEIPTGKARPDTTAHAHFQLPQLSPGDHEISVMVRNQSHNWDLGANDEHKEARGLISASLSRTGGPDFAVPIAWKIQGNKGGEHIADLVRGPMNNGGLYGERMGWYLPFQASGKTSDNGWTPAGVTDAPPAPGTYWLRAQVPLDLPKDQDVQLGLQIGDPDVPQSSHANRALIFVNGWQIGHFAANIGPQHVFVIPMGLLKPDGDNTITLAVTSDGQPQNALDPVKLVILRHVRGGVPLETVPSPSSTQR
ncbi:beta-galactosidase [Asticcacaulis sp. EMRT-3]|uniref:beta-galactosidase n=1 Tax=Asticcacaulis sp. EMRT-3 TaxID=3040349 RepID=UPI0024AFCC55|nr:beta-galactosidase [Asticcacaulis sp. EMRT-3]MDI7776423.1 beta-galactosidase [Asticcacaulis sp. EMRT-3]